MKYKVMLVIKLKWLLQEIKQIQKKSNSYYLYFIIIEEKSLQKKEENLHRNRIFNILKHQLKMEKMLIQYLKLWQLRFLKKQNLEKLIHPKKYEFNKTQIYGIKIGQIHTKIAHPTPNGESAKPVTITSGSPKQ